MDRGPAGPVIFFDGVCVVCNGFVDFLMARDRRAVFRFATLQGETAAGVLREGAPSRNPAARTGGAEADAAAESGVESVDWMKSLVLRDKAGLHRRSDAALRILAGLGGPWRLVALLRAVPRPLRDAVYDLVARNRYRWFGKHEACRMPTPAERERFLP